MVQLESSSSWAPTVHSVITSSTGWPGWIPSVLDRTTSSAGPSQAAPRIARCEHFSGAGQRRQPTSVGRAPVEIPPEQARAGGAKEPIRKPAKDAEDGENHEDAIGLQEQARLLQEVAQP
jgi:hypothetical protein